MSNPKLNLSAIAAALATIAEQFTVLEGAFRIAAEGGGDDGDDAEAGGKVPAAKRASRSKPAAKPAAKPSKGGEAEAAEITEDSLRDALKELAATKGKTAMAAALAAVGAGRLPDVDEDDYPALMEKITELQEAEEEEQEAKPAKSKAKAPAKPAKTKPAPVPDMDELTEKFKELIDVDKVAAKKILKDAGLAKLSEIDTDDDDAMREMMAAIVAAMPEDEDDMV